MTHTAFTCLHAYMLSQMDDAAHDREHITRVLYNALDIAATEENVDTDVLIAACLLHDVGRREQFADPAVCHARVGAGKAYRFLRENGFPEDFAARVRDAVRTHRFRADDPPRTLEAKILFDADKLDAVGLMGIARTLSYKGQVGDALYEPGPDGLPSDGAGDRTNTFFNEYKIKLEKLYDRFYTQRGRELAERYRRSARAFYEALLAQCRAPYERGKRLLEELIHDE